ncbi:AAA family ATPase [Streptomyces sp. BE230]|uniref:AAA family ATPase n=1 Tax=Streptomyces sp. BE230 TaxID=3002526 RepID=UPI002ED02B2E|nr:AAA family ATPase [Streptomyces sp. BE230]
MSFPTSSQNSVFQRHVEGRPPAARAVQQGSNVRLVELSVSNFRSLGDVQGIPIHKQTILTGHNDCGKTATLNAIAFLLGERPLADNDISQFAESDHVRAALPPGDDSTEPIAVTSVLPQLLYFRGDAAETPDTVVRSILTAKLREYTLREETPWLRCLGGDNIRP